HHLLRTFMNARNSSAASLSLRRTRYVASIVRRDATSARTPSAVTAHPSSYGDRVPPTADQVCGAFQALLRPPLSAPATVEHCAKLRGPRHRALRGSRQLQ